MPRKLTWPKFVRVFITPQALFRRVMAEQKGFGDLFIFLFIEYALVAPQSVASHGYRALHDPLAGIIGLWSSFLHFALRPAIGVFVVGLGLYAVMRRRKRRIEPWTAASVVTYAWVPHVLMVAIGVWLQGLGVQSTLLPQYGGQGLATVGDLLRLLIAFSPSALLAVIAFRTCTQMPPEALTSSELQRASAQPQPPIAMARGWAVVALFVVALGAAFSVRAAAVAENWSAVRPVVSQDLMPPFQLPPLAGGPALRSDELRGEVVLIDFWATWCGPCVASMPDMAELYRELAPRGVKLLSVNTEPGNRAGVEAFVAEHRLPFPVYLDGGRMQRDFRVDTFPSLFVVDRQNRIRHVHIGSTSIQTIRKELQALLSVE